MSKTKHTPAPWLVDDRHVHCASGFVYKDDRNMMDGDDIVCEVNTDLRQGGLLSETDKANLRLIAAAPELLAALEVMIEQAGCYMDDGEASEEEKRAMDAARNAISKATGDK